MWDDRWSTRWNPNVFAHQGYLVVAINPTGSTTFGQGSLLSHHACVERLLTHIPFQISRMPSPRTGAVSPLSTFKMAGNMPLTSTPRSTQIAQSQRAPAGVVTPLSESYTSCPHSGVLICNTAGSKVIPSTGSISRRLYATMGSLMRLTTAIPPMSFSL